MDEPTMRSFLTDYIALTERYADSQCELGVVLVELANLEKLRQQYGEAIAQLCQDNLQYQLEALAKRTGDLVGTIDDTKFALALTHADPAAAKALVADMMLSFYGDEMSIVTPEGRKLTVEAKVFAGVAMHTAGKNGFQTLETAYRALKSAKASHYSAYFYEVPGAGGVLFTAIRSYFASDSKNTAPTEVELDSVTGLPSMAQFEFDLNLELEAAEKALDKFSVLELSLHAFLKGESDTASRERILEAAANAVRKSARRAYDQCYRKSEDSFAIILPHAAEENLEPLLSDLRMRLRSLFANDLKHSPIELQVRSFPAVA